jgi:dolichol-phosphate mannosyltransferase
MSFSAAEDPQVAALLASDHTLIVVPTYNERNNIEMLLLAVRRAAPGAHILVVDDSSPDGTGQIVERFLETDANVHILHRPTKQGLGRAYVEGFSWGLARDYQYFVEMDADLSHNPSYLRDFFAAFRDGADVVAGSRNIPGGAVQGWGLGRRVLSKGGSLYSRGILGVAVRDLTTGFKAYTRRALEAIDIGTLRSNGYSFQIETTYRAVRCGLRVVEVPIVFVDRQAGKSKMDSRIFLEAVGIVWKLRREPRREPRG